MNHETKCANPHGHNYVAFFTAVGDLDDLGRVIDFSVLKERLGGWVDEHWDHTFIVYAEDRHLVEVLNEVERNKDLFIADFNPTAENMAAYLLNVVAPRVLEGTGVTLTKVRLWETENCYADAELEDAKKVEIPNKPIC